MSTRVVNLLPVMFFLICANSLSAQNYQAIHGSSQAGGLTVHNNPASILHIPFSWDITPIAIGFKHATNIITIHNYSLLSWRPDTVEFSARTGTMKRFGFANQDISLLNTRIRLDSRQAIAFGVNIRSYASLITSSFNWQDSLPSLRSFMELNAHNIPIGGEMRGAAWIEIFGSYARNLIDNGTSILNGGITLKVNRGIGGGYINASNMNYAPAINNDGAGYVVQAAELQYGYSMNFDDIDDDASFRQNRSNFLRRTYSTISASAGIEYILPAIMAGDEANDYNYDLKVGISVLDIGSNKYLHSNRSRGAVFSRDNIPDTSVQAAFENVRSIDELNDSLASVTGAAHGVYGMFNVQQPTRLLINVDKHIVDNLFINAELSLGLGKVLAASRLYVRDMNFFAITPRVETKTAGLYLPFTVNRQYQFWIGGAFKAGPLLLGVHNWANLFSKKKAQNGGAYLALTFRPGEKHQHTSRAPKNKLSRKQRRQLECPRL